MPGTPHSINSFVDLMGGRIKDIFTEWTTFVEKLRYTVRELETSPTESNTAQTQEACYHMAACLFKLQNTLSIMVEETKAVWDPSTSEAFRFDMIEISNQLKLGGLVSARNLSLFCGELVWDNEHQKAEYIAATDTHHSLVTVFTCLCNYEVDKLPNAFGDASKSLEVVFHPWLKMTLKAHGDLDAPSRANLVEDYYAEAICPLLAATWFSDPSNFRTAI